jgi:hypothetical protein
MGRRHSSGGVLVLSSLRGLGWWVESLPVTAGTGSVSRSEARDRYRPLGLFGSFIAGGRARLSTFLGNPVVRKK